MQPIYSRTTSPTRRAHLVRATIAGLGLPVAVALAFWWAPTATIPLQGGAGGTVADWPQKIFYLHVPIAFAAYWGFAIGAWNALLYLRTRDPVHDLRSYVGVHVGMVFGTLVLATGALWAKAAWGVWWNWGDKQLVVFLILYLYYCAYFMVRFSVEGGAYRARVSAIVTLMGIVLVPVSFLAVRVAGTLIHPTVIEPTGFAMEPQMAWTFLLSSVCMLALAELMMQLETSAKVLDLRLVRRRRPRRGARIVRTSKPVAPPPAAGGVDGN